MHAQLAAKEVVTRADLRGAGRRAQPGQLSLQTTPAFGARGGGPRHRPRHAVHRPPPSPSDRARSRSRSARRAAGRSCCSTRPSRRGVPEFAEAEPQGAPGGASARSARTRALAELEAARGAGERRQAARRGRQGPGRRSAATRASSAPTGRSPAWARRPSWRAPPSRSRSAASAARSRRRRARCSSRSRRASASTPIEFAAKKAGRERSSSSEAVDRLLLSLIEKRRQELEVDYNRQLLEQFGVLRPRQPAG